LNGSPRIAEQFGNFWRGLIHHCQIHRTDACGQTRIELLSEQGFEFVCCVIKFDFHNGLLKKVSKVHYDNNLAGRNPKIPMRAFFYARWYYTNA
jgi:hypothetical protein